MKGGKIGVTLSHVCEPYTKQWIRVRSAADDNDSSISSNLSSKLLLPTHIASQVIVINKPNRATKSLPPGLTNRKQLCGKGKDLFTSHYTLLDVQSMTTSITTGIDKASMVSVSNNLYIQNKANMASINTIISLLEQDNANMAAATSNQEMKYLIKFLLKNNIFDEKEKATASEEINIP